MKVTTPGPRGRGVMIVRDVEGIARFDDWDALSDEGQRRFRRFLTEYEREIFPLRNPVKVTLDRGHNGFPVLPQWDDLTLDEQEAYHALMTDAEREYYPLKEAEKWVHPTNPELPRKRTKQDAYSNDERPQRGVQWRGGPDRRGDGGGYAESRNVG